MNYPEHEKLRAREREANTLSGFLDTLSESRYEVVRLHDCDDECGMFCNQIYDVRTPSNEQLIGLHLGIDPKKLSAEKDAMYQELRKAAGSPV